MIHGNVVEGVMSFPEMDAMMYKIEGEDLYLIGTSAVSYTHLRALREVAVVDEQYVGAAGLVFIYERGRFCIRVYTSVYVVGCLLYTSRCV